MEDLAIILAWSPAIPGSPIPLDISAHFAVLDCLLLRISWSEGESFPEHEKIISMGEEKPRMLLIRLYGTDLYAQDRICNLLQLLWGNGGLLCDGRCGCFRDQRFNREA
jgi:hypothetical protein